MVSVFDTRSLFFKVISLPQLGYLTRDGVRVVIGDRISPLEVYMGELKYTHEEPIPDNVPGVTDSFQFALWKTGYGVVTAADYTGCTPQTSYPTPEDGIFTFEIRVLKAPVVNPRVVDNSFSFTVDSVFPLTTDMFTAAGLGQDNSHLIYTASGLKSGFITVQNRRSNSFTEADLQAGKVLYTSTGLGDGTEHLDLTVCDWRSNCASISMDWTIHDKFKQIGDNILYAKTDSEFYWEFQTNAPHAVWELVGGSPVGPKNVSAPSTRIIEWSTYATSSDLPEGDPGRGAGYDKLNIYRNIREKELWGGGLPFAVSVSNYGNVGTGYRLPISEAGSQPWRMPKTPGVYSFTLQAVDPRNGDISFRRYQIVVTFSGTSPAGLISESREL